ncbi:MAG: transporter [Candidatus Omnitrophota bacterium]|nr:transporter [Candidatus Omnitrophota bacterium]MDZ4242220.1 transporter [Candidatus Omnitrophota bacterium]
MRPFFISCAIAMALCPAAAYASDGNAQGATSSSLPQKDWTFSSSLSYETGDFGTNTTTNTVYIPLTLRRNFERWDAALTVPYIYQQSGPGVSALSGVPLRTGRSAAGIKQKADGLGDILMTGRYRLTEQGASAPFDLTGLGRIKFPSADEDKRLGTGEFDETIGLEGAKALNETWRLYADLYYTFIGEPPGTDLDNEFAYDLGVGYAFTDQTTASVFYEGRTALVDDVDDPSALAFYVTHEPDDACDIFVGLRVGLSDGSPDTGVLAGGNVHF